MSQALKDYYEKYWQEGRLGYAGDRQGYAANFRNWMHQQLHGIPRRTRILEVGCGDASFTKSLAEYSTAVTALDISRDQVEENTQRYPEITFLQHDVAEPLPFADGLFEVVWCSEVLEHLFAPRFALQEMHRVMAPGGRLLVTVPYHGLGKNLLIALFKWDEHFTPDNPHLRFYTRRSLGRLVAECGFEAIRTQTCGMNRFWRDLMVATNILLQARKAGPGDGV